MFRVIEHNETLLFNSKESGEWGCVQEFGVSWGWY